MADLPEEYEVNDAHNGPLFPDDVGVVIADDNSQKVASPAHRAAQSAANGVAGAGRREQGAIGLGTSGQRLELGGLALSMSTSGSAEGFTGPLLMPAG